ncbi:MAG TPA: methyltransferase domain-containing protein [Acidimicrobiales bacterium]|nr:methyltransferase domain-containing protein [Acidimicrobiales bacterium]
MRSRPVDSRYSDGGYLRRHPDWHETDADWKAGKVAALLQRERVPCASLADVGCGTAGVLHRLAELLDPPPRLVGFEPSPDAFRLASERGRGDAPVELVNGTLRDGDRFDVLLALDVIEHVPDLYGFLSSLHEHADAFVFHVPLDLSVQGVARRTALLDARRDLGHVHWFTAETLRETLAESGFAVHAAEYTLPSVELPGGGLKRRIAAIPRRLGARLSPSLTARLLGGCSLLVLARPR